MCAPLTGRRRDGAGCRRTVWHSHGHGPGLVVPRRGLPGHWPCAVAVAAVALAACGGLGASGSVGCEPHPLQRPARPDHPALVDAFEKKTGITVNVRSDDEDVLAQQIVTEGSHSPADVFFTENSPPLQYLASKGLLAPGRPSTLADTPARLQLARREVGRGLGPGERDGLQHLAPQAEPAPDLGHAAGRPEVEGQDRPGRRRDRLPAHRRRPSPAPTGTRPP